MSHWCQSVFRKISICIMLFGAIVVYGQEFKIVAKKKELGLLKVDRTENNGKIQIAVKSDILVKFLGKTRISYALYNEYENDFLVSSKVTTYVNDKLYLSSELKELNNGYEITKDGHQNIVDTKEIYTAAMLYTDEPVNAGYMFSEIDGIKKEITKIDDHHYEIVTPHKKHQTQEYFYENGALMKVIINHPIITFYLIRK